MHPFEFTLQKMGNTSCAVRLPAECQSALPYEIGEPTSEWAVSHYGEARASKARRYSDSPMNLGTAGALTVETR
jgi:hypothetical protein